MGIERQVISVEYKRRLGDYVPVYSYDYSSLEIGDWFILKTYARATAWQRSFPRTKAAKKIRVEAEQFGEFGLRVTRYA